MADRRFLIVDDDTTFCEILGRALARRGHDVKMAHNAEQALKCVVKFRPTHVVVDLKLGDDSGLRLIRPLLDVNKEIKVVVLTGYGSISTAVQAIKEGAVNYLAKPTDVDGILSAFDNTEIVPLMQTETPGMSLKRMEWEHIQRILDEHDGNISATARSLGMHRRTLQRKLQKRPVKQ